MQRWIIWQSTFWERSSHFPKCRHSWKWWGWRSDLHVVERFRRIQGRQDRNDHFYGEDGPCGLIGRPVALSANAMDAALPQKLSYMLQKEVTCDQVFYFHRARVEVGIIVWGHEHAGATCRNENIVIDKDGVVISLANVVSVVSRDGSKWLGSFGFAMENGGAERFWGGSEIGHQVRLTATHLLPEWKRHLYS